MKLTNKNYDTLKFIAIVILPAFTTFVGTVGSQLGYDMTTPVVILTALDTFIGSVLGLSNMEYNKKKGELNGKER